MSKQNRRLSEKEIQQVIRRAAEIQEARDAGPVVLGPTPDEVVKIGEDLGMSGDALRAAIKEVLEGVEKPRRGPWGSPLSFASSRVYEGELTEDDWHELVQELRRAYGKTGKVSEVAGAREWHGEDGGLDPIHVSARSKDGVTRVAIRSDLHGTAVLSGIVGGFPLLLGTIIFSKAAGLPPLAELAISGGVFGAALVGWRSMLGWIGGRRKAAIEQTEVEIERLTERTAEEPETQSAAEDEIRLRH